MYTKTKLISFVAILFAMLYSCQKESLTIENDSKYNNTFSAKEGEGEDDDVKKVILHVEFESFGRTSQDCSGFGLCQFVICLNCCVDANGQVVDCPTSTPKIRAGTIMIPENSYLGTLTVQLNPNDSIQSEAIINQSILYVDSDIVGDSVTIKAGGYSYSPSIGQFGGYMLDVERN
jgi:hypothetical protein